MYMATCNSLIPCQVLSAAGGLAFVKKPCMWTCQKGNNSSAVRRLGV